MRLQGGRSSSCTSCCRTPRSPPRPMGQAWPVVMQLSLMASSRKRASSAHAETQASTSSWRNIVQLTHTIVWHDRHGLLCYIKDASGPILMSRAEDTKGSGHYRACCDYHAGAVGSGSIAQAQPVSVKAEQDAAPMAAAAPAEAAGKPLLSPTHPSACSLACCFPHAKEWLTTPAHVDRIMVPYGLYCTR